MVITSHEAEKRLKEIFMIESFPENCSRISISLYFIRILCGRIFIFVVGKTRKFLKRSEKKLQMA